MKQLSPAARRLFELARDQDKPDALAENRVANALSVKIAPDTSLIAAVASATKSAAGLGSIAAKATLLVSATGVLVTAGWLALRSPPRIVSPEAAPGNSSAVVSPTPATGLAEKPPAPRRPSEANSTATKAGAYRKPIRAVVPSDSVASAAAAPEDRLRAETEALRLAQRALRDQMPQQALRLLDDQDRRFGEGLMHQERTAARILALCQAGRVDEARAQALRFEKAWPRSVLLARVRSACWVP
jgi:hypothetical protein